MQRVDHPEIVTNLVFGQADPGDLGVGVGHAGDDADAEGGGHRQQGQHVGGGGGRDSSAAWAAVAGFNGLNGLKSPSNNNS